MDSLARYRYDSLMPVVVWIPVGRFATAPDDSIHLGHYGYPPKSLILDGDSVAHSDELPPNQYGRLFAEYIDIAKSKPTYATVLIDSAGADSLGGAICLRLTVDSTPPGVRFGLVAVVTEDSVQTEGALGTTWHRVARRVVPDWRGRELNLVRGDTLYDTLRFSTTGLKPSRLKAAVFVQNLTDWTIVQSRAVNRFVP